MVSDERTAPFPLPLLGAVLCMSTHFDHVFPLSLQVCGTDGFLSAVCGPHVRVAVCGQTKLKKMAGPVLGMLGELGFDRLGVVVKL